MTQKTKTFYMRFYTAVPALDRMAEKSLRDILKKYDLNSTGEYVTPLIKILDYSYRIKICSGDNSISNCIQGYFVTYRDELLTKGNMATGEEELLQFNDNEAIIEKTYFSIFYNDKSEIVVFQNSRFGKAKDFSSYILNLLKSLALDGTIYLAPIAAGDFDLDGILSSKPSYIEYKLAKPRYKYSPDDDEPSWEQSQFALMDSTRAGTFSAKLSTRSALGLNKSKLKEIINTLLDNPHTRKCKVKLDKIDEPIDLFAEVLKGQFTLSSSSNGTFNELLIFTNIRSLKEKYEKLLSKYI